MPKPKSTKRQGPISRHCEHCGNPFSTHQCEIDKGWGRFCSRQCAYANRKRTAADRFAAHVGTPQPDSCIPWGKGNGYGRFWDDNGHLIGAHQFAWEQVHGPVPEGMCVCHHCDNPPCVNVDHLFLGTFQDNSSDMAKKGRGANGEGNGNSRLTQEDVVAIRRMYTEDRQTPQAIADRFGVSRYAVRCILDKTTWKHV